MYNKGFTLVETLVVIALFVIVGGLSVNLLFSAMKSSTKSAMMNQIKQNGDYALAIMERNIRNAKKVVSPCDGSSLNPLIIQNSDGTNTDFYVNVSNGIIYQDTTPLTSNNLKLTDSSNIISCNQETGKPANVTISFTLTPETNSWTSNDPAPKMRFQTSITLRNY